MNQLAHFFITYLMLNAFIPASEYFWPILIFSMVLDLDHIPGYVKMLWYKPKTIKDYVNLFRTPLQEPIGIIVIEIILFFIYFFTNNFIILIAIASILIHWLIDFLTVHTRPLSPWNNKIISLFFHTKEQRMKSEIIITIIALILFLV